MTFDLDVLHVCGSPGRLELKVSVKGENVVGAILNEGNSSITLPTPSRGAKYCDQHDGIRLSVCPFA